MPFGACRLCFVEIEGRKAPVTACTEPVAEGMVVHTNTPWVSRLRRTAFELLISHHHVDCRNCAKNRNCELQRIASRLGLKLKLKRLRPIPRSLPIDSSHPLFIYDPNKCVLCGKCVWVCSERGTGTLDFAFRAVHTVVSTFADVPLAEADCNSCDSGSSDCYWDGSYCCPDGKYWSRGTCRDATPCNPVWPNTPDCILGNQVCCEDVFRYGVYGKYPVDIVTY